ncbi:hypothetical protein ACNKU7_14860 [Microbulbifer sp. SA54]|uniref:hypothetical protein n=1 Tax=Microbulbifer sp. SA54 TaxID=3401577 RepID=UPI003AAB4688
MSGQQKFQIVSSGKVLRAKNPGEVLAEMASAFSISAKQARQLFLKGWVIKDQLSPGQVVQYRTQLQQIGLKIEVHPAGKFDNRALLARIQFARKRQARKAAGASAPDTVSPPARPLKPAEGAGNSAAEVAPNGLTPGAVRDRDTAPVQQVSAEPKTAGERSARAQLAALFSEQDEVLSGIRKVVAGGRWRFIPGIAGAALVPLLFAALALIVVYQAGVAVWNIPAAILDGSFGAGTLVGSGLTLLLLLFFSALFLLPYHRGTTASERAGISLAKADAPGVHMLLEVLGAKTGLPVPASVRVTPGAEIEGSAGGLLPLLRGEITLSLGLSAVTTVNGGDNVALISRALSYYQGRLGCLATWLLVIPMRRLQGMQDALENERTVLSVGGSGGGIARLPHKLLAASGLALIPLVDRLQSLHRGASRPLGRALTARADATAACILGSKGFSEFVARWHQLNHADLVTGEINREAQLVGKRLADYPAAVRWLFGNIDEETRNNLELAMDDDSDLWNLSEPLGTTRLFAVEDREFSPVLVRTDFTLAKLFADIRDLSARVSSIGIEDRCRAVDNQSLMAASKETEHAQRVLAEYFNRIVPCDLLPLQLPANEELQELDLQQSVDWLRSRLIELQELEDRYSKLQLRGAQIQLGAGLIRSNVKVNAQEYQLCGATPAAADESVNDNRVRIDECLQQRSQILSMFYQRIEKTIDGMDAAARKSCLAALDRLRGYEPMRESLIALERYGDLASLLVDRIPSTEIPESLMQKYVTVALQQCEKLVAVVEQQAHILGDDLAARLAGLEDARALLAGNESGKSNRDALTRMQALELHCKNVLAQVGDSYQQALAALLQECLAEEGRRNVRPLRLVGAL